MDTNTIKREYVVQYMVRQWWHNYYSYYTADDAKKSVQHLPECIKERPVRVVERVTTDSVIEEWRQSNG